ncbi:MAG: chromosome segregation protein SMC [Deltaproteobacteria bacterium]|nr:chromosome segregation protein SMC [Deltaproteobacteria bacterium]
MKLKKLEITGFKSFHDKVSIEFPPGISAVVGPNGCGKSNIIDALRWVMGEQSVKQLRGKSMEDVIFSGTNGTPPLNMAEVSLILSNDNGTGPEEFKEFSEIMLTRKLYRSGESAYFINKRPCRLKDIHNVFLGSGIGTKSYAVIQQGNIGAIIDAGPEERRVFLEEAAGITRYKNRKIEALRKVESTKQNLLRVSDIMTEVKRQMSGLKRQVKKAERYRNYQAQIKRLDVALAIHQRDNLDAQIKETGSLLEELQNADIQQSAKLKKLDAAIEEIKLKRSQKDQEIAEQKSRQFEMQRSIDRHENHLVHLRAEIDRLKEEIIRIEAARKELEEKNKNIQTEIHQLERQQIDINQQIQGVSSRLKRERDASEGITQRLSVLNQQIESSKTQLMNAVAREAKYKNIYQNASNSKERLKKRLTRLEREEAEAKNRVEELQKQEAKAKATLASYNEEMQCINKQISDIQKELSVKSEHLGKQVKKVQTLDLEIKGLRSRYTAMKRMEETYEWYKDGVRAVMNLKNTEATAQGVIGLVADAIEPTADCAAAVEAVLGDSLQYVLVKDQETAARLIEYLQETSKGRSGFIPVSAITKKHPNLTERQSPSSRLLNYVSVKPGYEKISETLLGDVLVAEDMQQALRIWNEEGCRGTIVTKSGMVILPGGTMIGGKADNGSGILMKKQELKTLKTQISKQERLLNAARENQQSLELEVRNVEKELQKAIERKKAISSSHAEAEKIHYRLKEDLKYSNRHLDVVRLEGEQLMGEESDLDDQIAKFRRAVSEAEKEVKAYQEMVAGLSDEIACASAQMNDYSQRMVDLKLNLTSLNAKLENNTTNLRRLKVFHKDGTDRLKEMLEDIAQKTQRRVMLKRKVGETEQLLSKMYQELKHLEKALETNRFTFQAFDEKLRENSALMDDIQSRREEIVGKIRMLEMEQSERHLRIENIIHQIQDRYCLSFDELREEIGDLPEMTIEEMETSLSQLRHKVSLMNDVNLAAIKEYETLKDRYDFLAEQHDDLVKAIDDLNRVIKKINRITRKLFLKTFHMVNEKLNEVFPRLFEGGSAQLVLTKPDDPLETGVEFMIHPPGKKLTRMSLLSGGEKALSAIAFIFSIYLIKPTAFCLLDEIDAPLDDVNVFRFNKLLQLIGQNSQIIMITHNKKTMEFADTLFGVTMENKGISKVVSVNFNNS